MKITALVAAALSLLPGSVAETTPKLRASSTETADLSRGPGRNSAFNDYVSCLQSCGEGPPGRMLSSCVGGCIETANENPGVNIQDRASVKTCVNACADGVQNGTEEADLCYPRCATIKAAAFLEAMKRAGKSGVRAPKLEASSAEAADLTRRPGRPAGYNEYVSCLTGCGEGPPGLLSTCVEGCIDSANEIPGVNIQDEAAVETCVGACADGVQNGTEEATLCYPRCASISAATFLDAMKRAVVDVGSNSPHHGQMGPPRGYVDYVRCLKGCGDGDEDSLPACVGGCVDTANDIPGVEIEDKEEVVSCVGTCAENVNNAPNDGKARAQANFCYSRCASISASAFMEAMKEAVESGV